MKSRHKHKKINPEMADLAEEVGEFIRQWGFKKVHGKIWLLLFLSPKPLDAASLIGRLGISKALVSMSLSDLMEFRVVLAAGKGPTGNLVYRANPDLMEAILTVVRGRERKILSRIEAAYRLVKKSQKESISEEVDPGKLEVLGEFIHAGEELVDAFLQFRELDLSIWRNFAAIPASSLKG